MASGTIPQLSNNSTDSYIKTPDGTLICWGSGTYSPNSDTGIASGSLYYFEFSPSISFPVEFIYTPSVLIQKLGGSEGAISWSRYSKTGIESFDVIRGLQNPNDPKAGIAWIAIGRWKA